MRVIRLSSALFIFLTLTFGASISAEESKPDWTDEWEEIKKTAQKDGIIPGSAEWDEMTATMTRPAAAREQEKSEEKPQPRMVTAEIKKKGDTIKIMTTVDPDGRRSDKYDYEDGHSLERIVDLNGSGDGTLVRIVECDTEGIVTLIETTDFNRLGQISKVRFWYPEGTTSIEYRNGKPFKRITTTEWGEIVKTLMS